MKQEKRSVAVEDLGEQQTKGGPGSHQAAEESKSVSFAPLKDDNANGIQPQASENNEDCATKSNLSKRQRKRAKQKASK